MEQNYQTPEDKMKVLNELAQICHEANKKWWLDLKTPCPQCNGTRTGINIYGHCTACNGLGHPRKDRNVGELLMLCVSELAEALEGHRKNLMDDKLPHRKMFDVEIADCFVRLFDLCGGLGIDLSSAFIEKMAYNATRADHKIENRKQTGGKAY